MGRPDTDFGVPCLLLTSSKLQGVPADRLLYQPRPSQDFCQDLARALGAKAPEVVCITAAGDLRQLRTLVAQDKAATGDGRGKTDQLPHTYFDTCRVLGGDLKIPEERVDFDWVEANLLDGVPDHRLDEARRAYKMLAELDAQRGDDGAQTASLAAQLAVRVLRRPLPWTRTLRHGPTRASSPASMPLLIGRRTASMSRADLLGCFGQGSEASAAQVQRARDEQCEQADCSSPSSNAGSVAGERPQKKRRTE